METPLVCMLAGAEGGVTASDQINLQLPIFVLIALVI